jgi:hypothetical protein
MNKRDFITGAAMAGAVSVHPLSAATVGGHNPGLLTVSGAIGKSNRGPLDPALDQMMVRHGVQFVKAFVFGAPALYELPSITIKPTLEYDSQVHSLSGPLLATVLEAAGVKPGRQVSLGLRAVDGYNVTLSLADARSYRMIVATHVDSRPLALGSLGPQWAVYEADTLAPFKDKPLKERFALCPWALYHIDVKEGQGRS